MHTSGPPLTSSPVHPPVRDVQRSPVHPALGPLTGPPEGFITTWKTDNVGVSDDDQVTIPTDIGGTYDCHVVWGDGHSDDITTFDDPAWTHTYSSAGTYTINISGQFSTLKFAAGGDRLKVLTLENFGEVQWESWLKAFEGCTNMTINPAATGDFSTLLSMRCAFEECAGLTSFPFMDTSNVTDVNAAWKNCILLTSFPLINMDLVTDVGQAWLGCSGLLSFPAISMPLVVNLINTWRDCSGLTSFPLISIPLIDILFVAWAGCSGLTSFPLLIFGGVTDARRAWDGCSSLLAVPDFNFADLLNGEEAFKDCTSLTTLVAGMADTMGEATNLTGLFSGVTLDTADWNDFLVSIESVNSNSAVTLDGGNSNHSGAGSTARAALIADHSWVITDGGP